ncbi:MAG: hypothetical protein R3F55_17830 [Alphaproteobacteria bacterium]
MLREGVEAGPDTAKALGLRQTHGRTVQYPRAVAFVDSLPRTETGKVQRFKLRDAG